MIVITGRGEAGSTTDAARWRLREACGDEIVVVIGSSEALDSWPAIVAGNRPVVNCGAKIPQSGTMGYDDAGKTVFSAGSRGFLRTVFDDSARTEVRCSETRR